MRINLGLAHGNSSDAQGVKWLSSESQLANVYDNCRFRRMSSLEVESAQNRSWCREPNEWLTDTTRYGIAQLMDVSNGKITIYHVDRGKMCHRVDKGHEEKRRYTRGNAKRFRLEFEGDGQRRSCDSAKTDVLGGFRLQRNTEFRVVRPPARRKSHRVNHRSSINRKHRQYSSWYIEGGRLFGRIVTCPTLHLTSDILR